MYLKSLHSRNFKQPYPETYWCAVPVEDRTGKPLCRPLPQEAKSPPPQVQPPGTAPYHFNPVYASINLIFQLLVPPNGWKSKLEQHRKEALGRRSSINHPIRARTRMLPPLRPFPKNFVSSDNPLLVYSMSDCFTLKPGDFRQTGLLLPVQHLPQLRLPPCQQKVGSQQSRLRT